MLEFYVLALLFGLDLGGVERGHSLLVDIEEII